jgi:predicted DNA-binding transcriptional regulator AlpA
MNFSKPNKVAKRYDKCTRTIMRWAVDPKYATRGFPKPIKIGDNSNVFVNEELDAYDEHLVAMRDSSEAKAEAG